MLGTLQSDMTRQGVSTTKKGECAACNKPIIGQVCTALGRTWHPEHFTCVTCEVPLGAANFFERDGRPFCERDYHEQFAPRCAYCSGPILDVSFLFFLFLVWRHVHIEYKLWVCLQNRLVWPFKWNPGLSEVHPCGYITGQIWFQVKNCPS